MDNEDEDDDLDVEQQASRNNRGTKDVTEIYYFVLALSLNEITTNNESLSTEQQHELIVLNCDRWIGLLKSEFGVIYRHHMQKNGITEEHVRSQAKQDNPKNMHRKAKEVVSYINNQMSPYWKEPEKSASGKGPEGRRHWNLNAQSTAKGIDTLHSLILLFLQTTFALALLVPGMKKNGSEWRKRKRITREINHFQRRSKLTMESGVPCTC